MPPTPPKEPDCSHIRNSDGTVTSFCNRCSLTIARAFDTEGLGLLESRHVCQTAERRQVVRLVHRTYDPTTRADDHLASSYREVLDGRSLGLSQSARVELIRAHLFSYPCPRCAQSVEQQSPNDPRVCFTCHLSLKDRWRELAGVAPLLPGRGESSRSHTVQFYSDEEVFLVTFTRFIVPALKAGNAVILATTESHRAGLFQRLEANGLDVAATVTEGRLIALDAGSALSTFMVDDFPDRVHFLEVASALVVAAAKAARGEPPRVAACGECAPLLWKRGKTDAAIRLEHLWDEIARTYDVEILCGYPGSSLQGEQGRANFHRICADHSAVYAR